MIYKLKYINRESGLTDLLNKKIILESKGNFFYGDGVEAIVEIGKIILKDGILDNDFNQIIEPIYRDGYHFDIMAKENLIFENEILPTNSKHEFLNKIDK